MKKLFLSVFTVFVALGMYATELNIYASGLNATQSAGVTTIDYVLNAPATALNVKLYDGSTLIATIPVTGAANLTKGSHSGVEITIPNMNGTFTWALEAVAESNESLGKVTSDSNEDYAFFFPRDVAVDNNPESDYFGRVYITNAEEGTTGSGTPAAVRHVDEGIFVLDAQLSAINSSAYTGGITWSGNVSDGNTTTAWGPFRLAIDDAGFVFITDNGIPNKASTGVYMMNPANPTTFESVLGPAGSDKKFHRANSIALAGTGASRVLYLIDWTDSLVMHPIGNSFPYTAGGTKVMRLYNETSGIYNAQNSIVRDKNGGFWISQIASTDDRPQLAHFTSAGIRDYYISKNHNSSLSAENSNRGAVGLNPSNTLVAFGGGGTVNVFSITDDNGTIGLTKETTFSPASIGNNIDGIAFDVADNLYVVSASKELLYVYATPKPDNRHETPAKVANTITATASPVLRTVTSGNYGTVCFPHEVTTSNRSGADFFNIAGKRTDDGTINGNPTSIVLEPVAGNLTAGQPYIFQATASTLSATFTGDVAPAGSNNGLIGSLTGTSVAEGMYLLSGNEIVLCGTGCSIAANRAYINMASVPLYGGSLAPGIREIPLAPQSGTSFQNVEETDSVIKFFENGRILILRGGVVYDTAGRVVRK